MGLDLNIRTETVFAEDQSWLGDQHGVESAKPLTLDGVLMGAIFQDGVCKSGAALGKVTATGRYGPYDPNANDGRQTAVYLLLETTTIKNVRRGDTTFHNVGAAGFWHGHVITAKLPTTDFLGNALVTAQVDAAAKTSLRNIFFA